MKTIFVTKADGSREEFSEEKLIHALSRANLPQNEHGAILAKVKQLLHEGVTTTEIGNWISRFLEETSPELTGKYSLKRALMELGPTGYPFEQFVARILQAHGYETQLDLILRGECVSHEIDVFAVKGERGYFVECKYHNLPGVRSDIKTALYVQARGADLAERLAKEDPPKHYNSWIFTNTKFSSDAITYAECKALRLTGWNYPEKGNLQEMVEKNKLYPITCLISLNTEQKALLFERKFVLVKDIMDNPEEVYTLLKLDSHKKKELTAEARVYS